MDIEDKKAGPETIHRTLKLGQIRRDTGLQVRAATSSETVEDYAEQLKRSVKLPAPSVFYDGTDHWLADGHHTYAAMLVNGLDAAVFVVREGTKRDALKYALGANQTHGLRLTGADKRHKVELALCDAEWRAWSDARVAELCGVSDRFVATVRKEIGAAVQERTGKDGRTINTSKVGRTRDSKSSAPATTPEGTPNASGSSKVVPTPNASESSVPNATVAATNQVVADAAVKTPPQPPAPKTAPPVDPVEAVLAAYDALTPADQKKFHRRLAARRPASTKQRSADRKAAFQTQLAATNSAKRTARRVDHGRAS